MRRGYLELHLWLKAVFDKLSSRQRRIFLYSVSSVYFLCSAVLIISGFTPEKETPEKEQTKINELPLQRNVPELIDTPIRRDSLCEKDPFEQQIT